MKQVNFEKKGCDNLMKAVKLHKTNGNVTFTMQKTFFFEKKWPGNFGKAAKLNKNKMSSGNVLKKNNKRDGKGEQN